MKPRTRKRLARLRRRSVALAREWLRNQKAINRLLGQAREPVPWIQD